MERITETVTHEDVIHIKNLCLGSLQTQIFWDETIMTHDSIYLSLVIGFQLTYEIQKKWLINFHVRWSLKKDIWKLNTPKIRHFLWRLFSNALPTCSTLLLYKCAMAKMLYWRWIIGAFVFQMSLCALYMEKCASSISGFDRSTCILRC